MKKPAKPKATPQAITVRFAPEALAKLNAMAKENGISRSALVQLGITRLLKTGL